jgi:hypothetical protein
MRSFKTLLAIGAVLVSTSAFAQKKASETGYDTKNGVIGGNFDHWQRGISFAMGAGATYTADRFYGYESLGTGIGSVNQSEDTPNSTSRYSLAFVVTTAQTSVGAAEQGFISSKIEGNNLRALLGKTLTLSFWVKSHVTGTYTLVVRNGTYTRVLQKNYTVNTSNVWEKKTITFFADPTGTWSLDESSGMELVWTIACGSDYDDGIADSWVTSDEKCNSASASTNVFSTLNNYFRLSQIMLNVGDRAAPFALAGGSVGGELVLAQRYTFVPNGESAASICTGMVLDANRCACSVSFPVSMRAYPTISSWTGVACNDVGATSTATTLSVDSNSRSLSRASIITNQGSGGSLTTGRANSIYFTSTSGKIIFSAEL